MSKINRIMTRVVGYLVIALALFLIAAAAYSVALRFEYEQIHPLGAKNEREPSTAVSSVRNGDQVSRDTEAGAAQ